MITTTYEFTRANARNSVTSVSAATDARAVLLNWSMVQGRSWHIVLDLPDLFVAALDWDERNDAAMKEELQFWCGKLDIAVSPAIRVSVWEPVAGPSLAPEHA